jgi:RNase P/RNase MRP subunit POP5
MKARLEDAIDQADRARSKIEIAALQLTTAGMKDHPVIVQFRNASATLREARLALLALRTA